MELRRILYFFLTLLTIGDGAKILIMITIPSPSLFNVHRHMFEALHKRKHDLTIQTIYPLKTPLPGVKVLPIKPSDFGGDEEVTKGSLLKWAEADPVSELYSFLDMDEIACKNYLEDESTKTLLAAGKQFDLVIADGFQDCFLVTASLLGRHIVDVLGSGYYPWAYSDVPLPPSYVTNYYRRFPSKMTFWQRMRNAADIVAFRFINDILTKPNVDKLIPQYIPNAPSVEEVHNNQVAFYLTTTDPVMYSPRPSMPNVINGGGLHCLEPKPLPKELNDFVEGSGDAGFIMFGLGTNMKSEYLPAETLDAILRALSRLKQRVIWKFEAQLENRPKNVMITKWMPQQDLLGHPKCRLFITHSGLLSLQEAVYHGVPVIGMPFFMDQSGNIARIQEIGMGEYLDFHNVTADGFYELINKVLTDKSYSKNARKYSSIAKDQLVKPLDKVIYWIEYVLRHDGMRHFRPASRDLNFFQYFLLDLVGFVLLVATVATGILVFLIKLVLRQLCSKKTKRVDSDKKRK